MRQEVQLAATELTEKAKAAARSAGFIVAGGALLQVACIAGVLAVIAGLYPTVPPWASAAGLGLVFVGAGAILVRSGLSTLEHLGTAPSETVTTLRDDARWVKGATAMSRTTESTSVPPDRTEETATVRLKQDIEHTREDLSQTISALEDKFSPSQIREVVGAELQQVEERVRTVLDEQLTNAKAAVHEEVGEAKTLLREGMRDAERLVKTGVSDARESLTIGLTEAKESVKQELKDAMNGASESIRAATLGKVENFATAVGDRMNDARDTLFDTIYNNPLPATVTGFGLLWLLMNRSRAASERRYNGSNAGGIGQVGTAVGRAAQQASGAVAQGLQGARSAAGDALDSASTS